MFALATNLCLCKTEENYAGENNMKRSGVKEESATKTLGMEWIVYSLALVVLLLAVPFPTEARKVFYFTCGLAGIG